MRTSWRLRLREVTPLDRMMSSTERLKWLRWRRTIPVRRYYADGHLDGFIFTCPLCGNWQPVSLDAGYKFVADPIRLLLGEVEGLTVAGVIECAVYRATHSGHPWPITRCSRGAFYLMRGRLSVADAHLERSGEFRPFPHG